jgi:hypothetical protein
MWKEAIKSRINYKQTKLNIAMVEKLNYLFIRKLENNSTADIEWGIFSPEISK